MIGFLEAVVELLDLATNLRAALTLLPPVPHIFEFSFFISTLYTHLLNMLKIKYDINQLYLTTVDLHFVKSQ